MNIFAEVLVEVLAEHGKELGSLYSMTDNQEIINQNKVGLLKKSLEPESDQSAVLSVWELDVMRAYFRKTSPGLGQPPQPITDDQNRRLKAAIFAEGVRRLVWERFKSEAEHTGLTSIDAARTTAYQIGRLVYNLLLTIKDPDGVRQVNTLMDTLRDVLLAEPNTPSPAIPTDTASPASSSTVDELAPTLATGVEIFMQGSLWLAAASEAREREQQRTLAAYAFALLERAQKFANDAPSSDQRTRWLKEISRAIDDTQDLV